MSLFEIQFKNSLPLTNPRLNFAEKTISYADLYIKAFPKNQKLLDFTNLLKDLLYKSVSLGNIITNFGRLTSNEDRSTLLANISIKSKELYEQYPDEDVRLIKDLSTYACLLEVLYNELNKIIQNLPKPSRPSSAILSPDSATTLVNFGSTLKRSLTKKGGKHNSRKYPRKSSNRVKRTKKSPRKSSKRTKRTSKQKSTKRTKRTSKQKSSKRTKRTSKRKSPKKSSNRVKRTKKSPRKSSKRVKRTKKSPRKTLRK